VKLARVGQVISPHGFHTRPGPFGQFVIDPGSACALAMAKGNALAIQLLASHAAATFLTMAKEAGAVAAVALQGRAQGLLALAERSAPETAAPTAVWDAAERELICNGVRDADTESVGISAASAPRERLIEVAKQIQAALQSPDPGTFTPTPIGPSAMSTGTKIAIAVGAFAIVGSAAVYLLGR
jgi:hypothetical protein